MTNGPSEGQHGRRSAYVRRREHARCTGDPAPGPARAAEVTLKLAHFLPPVAPAHAKLLKPWAEQVEAASDGRISIRIYPSMQLGGSPPQLFDQVRDGVADIAWTLPGYTPAGSRELETFELPFVASPARWSMRRRCRSSRRPSSATSWSEVHLICAWAHDQGVIHAASRSRPRQHLQGLKLRFPNRLAGEALTALGASADRHAGAAGAGVAGVRA